MSFWELTHTVENTGHFMVAFIHKMVYDGQVGIHLQTSTYLQ